MCFTLRQARDSVLILYHDSQSWYNTVLFFLTCFLTDLNDVIIQEQQQVNQLQRRAGLVIHYRYLQERKQDTIMEHFYYFVVYSLCTSLIRLGQG